MYWDKNHLLGQFEFLLVGEVKGTRCTLPQGKVVVLLFPCNCQTNPSSCSEIRSFSMKAINE